jgi:small multidrug resistance family-3 protein
MEIIKSLIVFILAGFCEIGGGYMIWLWLKEGKSGWLGFVGALILIFYGIIATLQNTTFGRAYAAYGGIFIVMSILWGWKIDHIDPDKYDIIGAVVVLIGVAVIIYMPRT